MTYTDMISAMDTGANYSNRGRKGYKKVNEKWTLSISTEYQTRTFTAYHKTEEMGRKWVEREIEQFQRTINCRNRRSDMNEQIEFYKIERIDRMGQEYNECTTYSTKTQM